MVVKKKNVAVAIVGLVLLSKSEAIIDSLLIFLLAGIIPGTNISISATILLVIFTLTLAIGVSYPFRRTLIKWIDIFVQHAPNIPSNEKATRRRFRQVSS